MVTRIQACTSAMFLVVSVAGDAGATLEWVSLPLNGCATSIAVGPNNVPWVTGCQNSANKEIFYLQYTRSCGGGICVSTPRWQDATEAAAHVVVNEAGLPWAITSSGAVLTSDSTGGNPIMPDGTWSQLSPSPTGYFAESFPDGNYPAPGGCISALAVGVATNCGFPELFDTGDNGCSVFPNTEFFGIGCSSSPDTNIFVYGPGSNVRTWAELAAAEGAAAQQIALFSSESPTGLAQSVWVLNAEGGLYRYNAADDEFAPMSSPLGTCALTAHFVASYRPLPPQLGGLSSGVFRWIDSTQSWDYYMPVFTPQGTQIKQLAYAEAYSSNIGTIGPSELWGVDQNGTIYFAFDQQTAQ